MEIHCRLLLIDTDWRMALTKTNSMQISQQTAQGVQPDNRNDEMESQTQRNVPRE